MRWNTLLRSRCGRGRGLRSRPGKQRDSPRITLKRRSGAGERVILPGIIQRIPDSFQVLDHLLNAIAGKLRSAKEAGPGSAALGAVARRPRRAAQGRAPGAEGCRGGGRCLAAAQGGAEGPTSPQRRGGRRRCGAEARAAVCEVCSRRCSIAAAIAGQRVRPPAHRS